MRRIVFVVLFWTLYLSGAEVTLQVLGSGGPEVSRRASSGYLIWVEGKSRYLIDMGGGTFLRFGESGAKIEDLSALFFTHFHIDHSSDFPALLKAGVFSARVAPLPIYGPTGNAYLPGTEGFLEALFNEDRGVYPYMSGAIRMGDATIFPLLAESVDHRTDRELTVLEGLPDTVCAIGVHHGPLPALGYRFEIGNRVIAFSGDTDARTDNLVILAKDADLFVAHHAIPEEAGPAAMQLHMPPSKIGEIAAKANVKALLLSHRMLRTLGKEKESERIIRKSYKGPIFWAEDLLRIPLGKTD